MPTPSEYTSGVYRQYVDPLSRDALRYKDEGGFRQSEPNLASYARRVQNSWDETPGNTQKLLYLASGRTPEEYKRMHPENSRSGPALNAMERAADWVGSTGKKATDAVNLGAAVLTRSPSAVLATGAAQGGLSEYLDKRLAGESAGWQDMASNAAAEGIGGLVGDKYVPDFNAGIVGEALGKPLGGNVLAEIAQLVPEAAGAAYTAAKPYVQSFANYINPFKEAQAAEAHNQKEVVSPQKKAQNRLNVDPSAIPYVSRYL